MQARQSGTRTIPPIKTEEQWDALVQSVASEGGAIVESRSGERVAVISYKEFLEIKEQRRKQQVAEAYTRLQAAMKEQDKLNQDLSKEEAERIAQEFSREFYEDLAERGVINVRRTRKA